MAQQVWFITGASSGFGEAFARYAIAQGHKVVVTARSVDKLAAIAAEAPEQVLVQALDVTRAGDAEAAVKATLERFGRIDVLINNAGFGIVGAIEETPMAELRAQMETNFFGAVAVTQAALPTFRAQRAGAIVNISSLGGQLSLPGFGAYSASKFALEGVSEALAAEMKPFGVKVMIVEPGSFRTNLAGGAMRHMPALDAYADTVGATRDFAHSMHDNQPGDPAKVAPAVAKALAAEVTPMRLQLGADAIEMIRTHSQQLLADLEAWTPVALDTAL